MKNYLLIALLFYCSCSKSQDIVYRYTDINQQKDTVTFLYAHNLIGEKDTIQVLNVRRYNPPPLSSPSDLSMVYNLIQSDLSRPAAGANNFYGGDGHQTPFPYTYQDNDQRFYWSQLQTGSNTFNWKSLDDAINKCISTGAKLSFRVITADSDYSGAAYPSFVGTSKYPDFNSESYIGGFERFIAAMAAHLNSTGLIRGVYKIDIGGIGNWSEMHWFFPVKVPVITASNVKRIVNAYTSNFANTWLMITVSGLTNNSSLGLEAARYLLNARNNLGPVGIRSDHLGDAGTFSFDMNASKYYASDFLSVIKDRWKTSPMAGELMNNLSAINSSNPYGDLTNEVNGWHLSQFSNNNWCRNQFSGASATQVASSDKNILAASQIAGARIGISNIKVSGGNISITWTNSGPPVYENWEVYINGVKSAFNLKSVTGTITWTEAFTGSVISIIIKDPTGVRKPYPLLNTGRLLDGSYKLF